MHGLTKETVNKHNQHKYFYPGNARINVTVHPPSTIAAFNMLSELPDWLCHRMTRTICLSAYIMFSIQTPDQLVMKVASQ